MNTEHLNEWIAALRSGEHTQARGALVSFRNDDDKQGFCCLGLGSVLAGCEVVTTGRDAGRYGIRFVDADHEALPGKEFMDWLGIETNPEHQEFNIPLQANFEDLMREFPNECNDKELPDGWCQVFLAVLNDREFTFAQIADILERFSIDEDYFLLSKDEQTARTVMSYTAGVK